MVLEDNKIPNPDFLTRECLDFYRLAFRLAPQGMKKSPELEVYAVNSGAEVVENMLKYLISRHNTRVGRTDTLRKRRFIVFRNSFHGRTLFALSLTTVPSRVMTKDFHPLFSSHFTVDFPAGVFSGVDPKAAHAYNESVMERTLGKIETMLKANPAGVVGIVMEPIQGAGGHNVAPPVFFERLSRLVKDYEIQTGFDEVQTGMGGCGRPFYVDGLNLAAPPTALVVAKKFGVGVLYMLDHLKDVGVLDSTWGGPLVDMVRAQREIEIVRKERLIPRAARLGERLRRGLIRLEERYPDVLFNVRGLGFLQGFSVLPTHGGQAREALLEIALRRHGLLMLGAGRSSVRVRPNLSTAAPDVDRFLGVFEEVIKEFRVERPRVWETEALRQRRGSLARLMRELG